MHHLMSSACHPMSNGKTELAVKATKQFLIENIGPNGELNTTEWYKLYLRREIRLNQDANYPLHKFFWDEN